MCNDSQGSVSRPLLFIIFVNGKYNNIKFFSYILFVNGIKMFRALEFPQGSSLH
jgi:hypothetical protein